MKYPEIKDKGLRELLRLKDKLVSTIKDIANERVIENESTRTNNDTGKM